MGKEAEVDARFGDATDHGRLQYEPPKLIFRGAERRVFEGEALRSARADGVDLVVERARFTLGEKQAQNWAQAILNPKGRLDKLGVKAGQRVAIVGLDDPDFAAELAVRASPCEGAGDLDILFYGADSQAELAEIPTLLPRLAERGALWIVSFKGKRLKVKDTEVMAAAKAAGLVDSKVCAFSDTRTALRFTRRR
ncbi:MAG TPA: DUF3052 domain-containing protein [Caulobacteraceae bacterium]|nr:DUF3052 domain-containing protein [Caulobacteraceae bacterium]